MPSAAMASNGSTIGSTVTCGVGQGMTTGSQSSSKASMVLRTVRSQAANGGGYAGRVSGTVPRAVSKSSLTGPASTKRSNLKHAAAATRSNGGGSNQDIASRRTVDTRTQPAATLQAHGRSDGEQYQAYNTLQKDFLTKLHAATAREDSNQMGRAPCIGVGMSTTEEERHLQETWAEASNVYDLQRHYVYGQGSGVCASAAEIRGTVLKDERVWRTCEQHQAALTDGEASVSFDPLQNYALEWRRRYAARQRFVLAARTVVFRHRAARTLALLQQHYPRWRHEQLHTEAELQEEELQSELEDVFSALASAGTSWDASSRIFPPAFAIDVIMETGSLSSSAAYDVGSSKPSDVKLDLQQPCMDLPTPERRHEAEYEYGSVETFPIHLRLFGNSSQTIAMENAGAMDESGGHLDVFPMDAVSMRRPGHGSAFPAASQKFKPLRAWANRDESTSHLSLPMTLCLLPRFPPMHAFQANVSRTQYSSAMPFTEVSRDYHLSNPLNPFATTNAMQKIEGLLGFQDREALGLSDSACTPLSAVWPVVSRTPVSHSAIGQAPDEQEGLDPSDHECVYDDGEEVLMDPAGVNTIKLRYEQPAVLPPLVEVRTEQVLSGKVHQLPALAVKEQACQCIAEQEAEGYDHFGGCVRNEMASYVQAMRSGQLKKQLQREHSH